MCIRYFYLSQQFSKAYIFKAGVFFLQACLKIAKHCACVCLLNQFPEMHTCVAVAHDKLSFLLLQPVGLFLYMHFYHQEQFHLSFLDLSKKGVTLCEIIIALASVWCDHNPFFFNVCTTYIGFLYTTPQCQQANFFFGRFSFFIEIPSFGWNLV